jgi:hypothetical protein
MFYADLVGLDKVYDAVSRLYDSYGDWVKPSELLVSLAKDGKSFADYTACSEIQIASFGTRASLVPQDEVVIYISASYFILRKAVGLPVRTKSAS